MKASLLVKISCELGEGPMWHSDRNSLFWVDIEGKKVYEYQPENKRLTSWFIGHRVSLIIESDNNNILILAVQGGIVSFNLITGKLSWLAELEKNQVNIRTNDGACDNRGNIWIGTMALDFTENAGSLYIIDKNYSISRKVDQLTIPNGLVFSLDHRYMYHIDSTTRKVAAYQYDPVSGNIRWEKIAIQVPKENGAPDGMCIDEEGMLWIAQWGGFGVYRYNPLTGELLTKIDVPVPNVSSCVFGGKNFDQLYITTAREHLSEKDLLEYPDSGSVYFASPGVKGMAGNKWNLNNI